MLRFKEKKALMDLINEFHWYLESNGKKSLYVFVDYYDMPDFMKFFSDSHPSLFDDEGIDMKWKGSYMCIPNFDNILEYIGESWEDINEMFEEE